MLDDEEEEEDVSSMILVFNFDILSSVFRSA